MAAWIFYFDEVPFTGGNTVDNVGEWRMRERVLLSQTTHHVREHCWLTHLHSGVILRFMVDVSMRASGMLNLHKIIGPPSSASCAALYTCCKTYVPRPRSCRKSRRA